MTSHLNIYIFFPLCVTGNSAQVNTKQFPRMQSLLLTILTGRDECIRKRNKSLLQVGLRLVSQARFTSAKKKGLVNCSCVYKPCPTISYSVVQSCYSILSHNTLHHCLVWWDMACIQMYSSPDPFLQKWIWLVRLVSAPLAAEIYFFFGCTQP